MVEYPNICNLFHGVCLYECIVPCFISFLLLLPEELVKSPSAVDYSDIAEVAQDDQDSTSGLSISLCFENIIFLGNKNYVWQIYIYI